MSEPISGKPHTERTKPRRATLATGDRLGHQQSPRTQTLIPTTLPRCNYPVWEHTIAPGTQPSIYHISQYTGVVTIPNRDAESTGTGEKVRSRRMAKKTKNKTKMESSPSLLNRKTRKTEESMKTCKYVQCYAKI